MRRLPAAPSFLTTWAHLAVLWSFAVAKPLFDILADSPEFFVARENTAGDIIALALGVTLIPPTVLLLVELALSRLPRARAVTHLVFVGLLTSAIALQALEDVLGRRAALQIAVALALGAAGALAYARLAPVPATLSVLSPLPAIFVALFLLFSPVSDLVLPKSSHASAGTGAQRPTPVVMAVFDELSGASLLDPSGRIDASRYPNFARLARESTWYRNATTVADFTSRAVPSILTGLRPQNDELPTRADHPDNVFTLLGPRYRFHVEEPTTELCPPSLCGEEERPATNRRLRDLVSDLSIVSLHRLLPEELEDGLPAVDQTFSGFGGAGSAASPTGGEAFERRPAVFEQFVHRIHPRQGKPTLDLIHTELPHAPWDYLPSGQSYTADLKGLPGTTMDQWNADERLLRQGEQRYLLQLAFVDRLLGRLLDRLAATGLLERALVIVTADHGLAFQPNLPRRAITAPTLHEIASIPLFIKAPGQRRGRTDDSAAHSVDIVPTIADELGVRLPWSSDGRSLNESRTGAGDTVRIFGKYENPLELPFTEFIRRRDAEVRRNSAAFGAEDGGHGVFAGAGEPRLIGRRVADLPAVATVRGRAELDDPRAYADLHPGARTVPIFLSGSVSGIPASRALAVAANGRIAATAETFDAGTGIRFEAFLDPSALRRGANDVATFELVGRPGAPRLAPLSQSGKTYRLTGRGGSEALVAPSGRRIPIEPGAVDGFVDSVDFKGGKLRVGGWSAAKRRGSADEVVAFQDRRFLAARTPSVARPDLVKGYGIRALLAGFSMAASVEVRPDMAGLRVFGVLDGRASELVRPNRG